MATLFLTFSVFLVVLQPPQHSPTKEKPPNDSNFSILQIAIGKDNFQTLQEKLGPTRKCHAKDHDGVEIAGYAGSNQTLIFEFGEIGGGDVTGFILTSSNRTSECPLSALPARDSNLATNAGVRLGMTEQEFARVFGSPTTKTRPDHWKYEWTLEARYTEDEKKTAASAGHPVPADTYLVGITIEAEFKNGKLVYFYINRLETT